LPEYRAYRVFPLIYISCIQEARGTTMLITYFMYWLFANKIFKWKETENEYITTMWKLTQFFISSVAIVEQRVRCHCFIEM
jgi:hypothetical protein